MDFFRKNLLVLVALNLASVTLVFGSPCAKENRTTNFQACKNEIQVKLLEPSLFWFGTQYAQRCPNGEKDGFLCSNPDATKTSMAPRLFSTEMFAKIDRFLELNFESNGQDYTSCGNTFKTTETWRYDVDPTSDTVVTPWYVKNFPVTVKWNYTAGDMFTMIIYDVGYKVAHGVYVNIQGNDMMTAKDIKPYHGPQSSTNLLNPYIFLLFKQQGAINVSQEWINNITRFNFAGGWSLEKFVADYNMTDNLVAVNWIVATGDEYGAKLASTYVFTCPIFATKALLKTPRPFISNDTLLTVWMDFTFMNDVHQMTVCCKTENYPARNVTTNPIGDPIYSTWETRSEAKHSLTFTKMGLIPQMKNFTGDLYTVIAIDPDVPSAAAGTQERPLLHGMVTNIRNGDMSTGDQVMNYSGPTPPDYKPHFYYTLLYKQHMAVNGTALRYNYVGNCSGGLAGRCLFDINRVVSDYMLTLVGATWFRATTDGYVRYRKIQGGESEELWCKDQPGYANPCPTQSSPITFPSVLAVCFFSMFAQIFSR